MSQGRSRIRKAAGPESRLLRAWRAELRPEDWRAAGGDGALRPAAQALARFGARRRAGQVLLRIAAGPLERATPEGAAPYTVIELVTDDMPFLVDTLSMTVAAAGHAVHALFHPILAARRDGTGRLRALAAVGRAQPERGTRIESWQRLHVSRLAGNAERVALERALRLALAEVRAACGDWQAMRAAAQDLVGRSAAQPGRLPAASIDEGRALLGFMLDNHFTFQGYRRSLVNRAGRLVQQPGTGLGILREGRAALRPEPRSLPIGRHARSDDLVVVTQSNLRSRVHRPGYLDYVGVKLFDKRGQLRGEARFLGQWTSTAYHADPAMVPLVRAKVRAVAASFRFRAASHDAKRLASILDNLPRDELFQATVPQLQDCARAVLALQERPRSLCLVLRRDEFGRFWSALLYVGRERLDNDAFQRIEAILRAGLGGGPVDSSVAIGDAPLARIYFKVHGAPLAPERLAHEPLERAIEATLVSWRDRLRTALLERHDEATVLQLEQRHAGGWPASYQQDTSAEQAVRDIADLGSAEARGAGCLRLLAVPAHPTRLRMRLLRHGDPLPISSAVPLLENFGLRVSAERPYRLQTAGGGHAWVQELDLEHAGTHAVDLPLLERELAAALPLLLAGELDNDGFHRLVLAAGLGLAQLRVLRACCRYLLQTGLPFAQSSLERTLAAHPHIARGLWELFALRLDPAAGGRGAARAEQAQARRLLHAIGEIASPDDDRILRACLAVVQAILRTNHWQPPRAGAPLVFKLDPRAIPGLPEPRPAFELFVHGTRVEGVHMRRGAIARGGIRWSERPDDFRTEVLGLMKAQHVKNTLIVPVGAKGGFVARRLRPDAAPAERAAEVKACYQAFIRALLDVTDNIVDGQVQPPPSVRRRDGDDPYLVVAADKGTASFSDVANAISAEYHFWLGDAFASGGSAGYDHKAMGITARGGWECVKRHFRELGLDIQRDPLTVAGIGDMSGDVFGNGMLLSRSMRLVAAFDHRHVFIDPSPDAARAFRERARLFALPGSSWDDYDRKALSTGGGVYSRSLKQLVLSREARALLGLASERVAPVEVVRAILKAPVDLLWNGGIGTYVKASSERNGEIGDRGNDAVRIDGRELRARVVGEGGNLGFSQRGRIEYAQAGGRINTDFVDNSAGVNTSDIEVNLKIMLAGGGRGAPAGAARRRLLASVTDEVAAQVLRNNYLQSQALSLLERRAPAELGEHQQLLRALERSGELDRAVELLPADDEIEERMQRGQGLVRPELAVLLAYGKIALHHALMQAGIADDPYLAGELERYFPARWRKRFARPIAHHRLRTQLICTATTNSILNRMDPGFVQRLGVQTGASIGAVARAYTIARDAAGLRELWSALEALDLSAPAEAQYEGMLASRDYVEQLTRRLVLGSTQREPGAIADVVGRLQPAFRELRSLVPAVLGGLARERYDAVHATHAVAGLPGPACHWLAALPALRSTPDLARLAAEERRPLAQVTELYFRVAQLLGVDWLGEAVRLLPVATAWQGVARERLYTACLDAQRELCRKALRARLRGDAGLERWPASLGAAGAQWFNTLRDLRAAQSPELAALMAGAESLRLLA